MKKSHNNTGFSKEKVWEQLKKVLDPELSISIVDLGLVYTVTVNGNNVEIVITLTTMGCPLVEVIQEMIKTELNTINGIGTIDINLTFDPPWNPDKMSKEAKIALGFC